jgi:hypothetical protein
MPFIPFLAPMLWMGRWREVEEVGRGGRRRRQERRRR